MKRYLPLFALPLLAAPIVAQQMMKPGTADRTKVTAGTYTADPSHSAVAFEVNHLGFSDYPGLIGDLSGSLTIDPANMAATKVEVSVPIASIYTTSSKLTGELKGERWFNAAKNPNATFVSTGVTRDAKDPTKAKVAGNLTIMGVTKAVVADVEFTGAGVHPFNKKNVVGFEAEIDIKRSDFGLGAMLPAVGDEVELEISAEFQK